MTQADQLTMGDVALKYARAGLKVFPLQGKIPFKGTQGCKEATTNEAQIQEWWSKYPDANIGIATGDGLVVVDFDKLGPAQTELYLDLPAEWVVSTGKGVHVYLRVDDEVRNSAGKLLDHVDIRGEGGYVVAAASVHPDTGRRYRWKYPDRMEAKPPMAPASLLERIKRADQRVLERTGDAMGSAAPLGEGGRNAGLASLAGTMRARGFTQGSIEAALLEENQLRCTPPLPDDEVRRIAASIGRYPAGEPQAAPAPSAPAPSGLPELSVESLKADPQLAFRRDTVAHFVHVEHNDPGKWEEYKQMFRKANIGIKSVSAQMRRHALAQRPKIENAEFEDAPIRLQIPDDFRMDEGGIYKVGGEHGEERILPVPLLMTKRLKDHDTGEERVEIAWRKDGSWQDCVANRSTVSKAQEIVSLADHGLPITSNTSAQVVKYLSDLEALNKDKVSLERCIRRTGWAGRDRFIPGQEDGIVYTPEGYHLRHVFNPEGTLDEWVAAMQPIRDKYPLVRLQLATAFASPLLKPLGARNFMLHVWSRSGTGKTAAMRGVVSVWGTPKLMVTFNSTPLGLILHASMLNHLPVCINERQLGARNLDSAIYSLVEGTAKLQGQRQGGLRHVDNWHNIILTNGEEPMTTSVGMQGTKNRVIEIMGDIFDNETAASQMYAITDEQYGTAGPAFITKLIQVDRVWLAEKHAALREAMLAVAVDGQSRNHVISIATLCLADYLSSMWVFGAGEGTAWSDAIDMGLEVVMESLEYGEDFNQGERLYEQLVGRVSEIRDTHFGVVPDTSSEPIYGNLRERYGYIEKDEVWILTTAFERICRDMGVPVQTMRMHLAESNMIRVSLNGEKRRFWVRKAGYKYNVVTLPK